jgi:hypothetical protein
MTQETVTKQPTAEISTRDEPPKKKQISVQELVESLKSVADDIGQISELSSEEKLLVAQFFKSLLKLMQPLTPAITVSLSALPTEPGMVTEAYIDPTGHLAMMYRDGHMELKNLSEDKNRDLMITVIEDIMPKFKSLTSAQKRKIENRIKFLTTVTKETQKISETLATIMNETDQ